MDTSTYWFGFQSREVLAKITGEGLTECLTHGMLPHVPTSDEIWGAVLQQSR